MDVKQKGHQETHVNALIIEAVVVNVQEFLLFLPQLWILICQQQIWAII